MLEQGFDAGAIPWSAGCIVGVGGIEDGAVGGFTEPALQVGAEAAVFGFEEELGEDEVEYHKFGLTIAPPFPSYRW